MAEIVLIERGKYISFANCGLPYHISGIIEDREQLLVTSESTFKDRYCVDVRSLTEAILYTDKTTANDHSPAC
jgi:tRNA 2-thiouridine synthesizing protein A